jgi:hypothetical protein
METPSAQERRLSIDRLTAGGTGGNERLTAATGMLLLVLLAALGVTILRIGQLLNVHMYLGMLLIGPVVLKLASTGYRFARYYTSEPRYRRKGPPPILLRLIAPIVVLSTVVVFASGVILMLVGPRSQDPLLAIHKYSFFAWLAVTGLHVLGHLAQLPRALRARSPELPGLEEARAGRDGRALALGGALLAGVVLCILSISEIASYIDLHS